MVLRVNHLSVGFDGPAGPVQVVRDVSLSIDEGEIVGLVGESGCGKSVTSLALMGLLPENATTTGSITLCGREVVSAPEKQLRSMRGELAAMIFQNPMSSMNPFLTIGRQMTDAIRCHRSISRREAQRKAGEALDSVRLADSAHLLGKYPHQLSGGQLQRVMIAMAISLEPRLLIADEATTALDVTVQAQVLLLIRDLARRLGLTILFISHDLGVIATLCDRVIVMYAGRIVESASTRALFSRPRHPYTHKLLGTVPRLGRATARLTAIPGTVPDLRARPSGCAFRNRCERADETCAEREPEIREVEGTHSVACFHPMDVEDHVTPTEARIHG